MASTIKIRIDGNRYRIPKEDDIRSAKDFILQRNENARALASRIDEILDDIAEQIVTICYRYDVDPLTFTISYEYNEDMMNEIAEVMDQAEELILNLIYEYSTRVTADKDHMAFLVAWIQTLGRNNRNQEETLYSYLFKTMKDYEAAIAALRYKEFSMADAITKIKMYKHQIYSMPEIMEAFKHSQDFSAQYIQTLGVQAGAVGLSNSGATNVTNMAKTTLQMAWMRGVQMEWEEDGAVGYMCFRGSTYECPKCDDVCNILHDIKGQMVLPVHPNCCCYAVPIYPIETE